MTLQFYVSLRNATILRWGSLLFSWNLQKLIQKRFGFRSGLFQQSYHHVIHFGGI